MATRPPTIPPGLLGRQKSLLSLYAKAEERIRKQLSRAVLTDFKEFRLQEQLTQVEAIVAVLDKAVKDSSGVLAQGFYGHGADWASRALEAQGVKVETLNFGNQIHHSAVGVVADQMVADLATANQSTKRTVQSLLRQTKQKVLQDLQLNELLGQHLITGETRLATSKRLQGMLEKALGEGKLVQAGGRHFTPKYYAELVTRTRTREAVTQGAVNFAQQYGVTTFQVSVHAGACDECLKYQGKVYSTVAGGKFPLLDMRPPYHPNCGHVLVPYVEVPGKEDEAEALARLSNEAGPLAEDTEGYRKTVETAQRIGAAQTMTPGFKLPHDPGLPKRQYARLKNVAGDILTVRDYNLKGPEGDIIRQHVADLDMVPSALLAKLRRNGLQYIAIGRGSCADFGGLQYLKDARVPWQEGRTFDNIAGLYDPKTKSIVAGTKGDQVRHVIPHEIGHALGDLLGYNGSKQLRQVYDGKPELIPALFKEVEGPPGKGREEFFAWSVANGIMNQDIGAFFGEGYAHFITNVVLKGKDWRRHGNA